MLRFDLTEIIRTPAMRQVFEINEQPYGDDDVEYISPVLGKITVTNTGTMLLIRGPIHATISQECSRCLEPTRTVIDTELEEDFDLRVVEDSVHRTNDIHVVDEEIGGVFDGKILQLNVLIRQAALLGAPLQPLCRPDCPGIAITSAKEPSMAAFVNSPFSGLSKLLED